MNWAWASTLDRMWRSPAFPMWLTVAVAVFFAVIVFITLLRAEKSVANGALALVALLAVGIALTAATRGLGSGVSGTTEGGGSPSVATASLPALACVDDLAGDLVLSACERALFGSPEATAAALSYAARQITRLTSFGDVAAASKNMTPELEALRRAVERDRYGLMAEVLAVREHCTPTNCAAFRSLTDSSQVSSNLSERTYEGLIGRHSIAWNASATAPVPPVPALIPGVPTGKPTNAEFPSASSTPPVSIMTAEPTTASASRQPAPPAASPSPKPATPPSPTVAAAKKQPAPKPARSPEPAPAASQAPAAASTD